MQLEDALVGCSLPETLDARSAPGFCRELIAFGCDMIACPAGCSDRVAAVGTVCREEDVLLLVTGVHESAMACDGILLEQGTAQVGAARALVGEEAILGSRVASASDAALALELGIGFLLCSGVDPVHAVGALPGAVGIPLFVGGAYDVSAIDGGRYRFWVEAMAGLDAPAAVRACSRAVGRVV